MSRAILLLYIYPIEMHILLHNIIYSKTFTCNVIGLGKELAKTSVSLTKAVVSESKVFPSYAILLILNERRCIYSYIHRNSVIYFK